MEERFQISLDAAQELLHSLRHPDNAVREARDRTLQRINETMTIIHQHGQDILDIPGLDLSFLDDTMELPIHDEQEWVTLSASEFSLSISHQNPNDSHSIFYDSYTISDAA